MIAYKGFRFGWQHVGILFIVWFAFLMSFVDRLSWPPIMPIVARELGMSAKQAGSYMTAFYIGYVLTQIPGGLLTDRFGYRKTLIVSFLTMGTFTALMGTVSTYEQGLIYRVLAGIGSGAVYSASVRAIFDWFPAKVRTTAMGFFLTASSLGLTVVNISVPIIAREYGWHISFYVVGGITILMILAALLIIRERPKEIETALAPESNFRTSLGSLLTNRNVIVVGLAGFCAIWATWGTATWANTYMNKSLNISLVEAGKIMSLYGLTALVCKPLAGIMADYFAIRKKVLISIMLAFFGPALLVFGVNQNVQLLYYVMPILGITAFIYSPALNTLVGELVHPSQVATAIGLVNAFWQIGSILSPLVIGAILDQTNNYFYAFCALAIGPMLGSLIILRIDDAAIPTRL